MCRPDVRSLAVLGVVTACGGGGSTSNPPPQGTTTYTSEQCEAMLQPSTDFTTIDLGVKPEGRARYNVFAESVIAIGATSALAREEIRGACAAIARDLDAPPSEQRAADGAGDPSAFVKAWCKLAASRIRAFSTSVSFRVSNVEVPCIAPDIETACLARCTPQEPSCKPHCDRLIVAKTVCSTPSVSINLPPGANTEAQRAKTTIEANLGPIVVLLRGRGQAYVQKASEISSEAERFTDVVDGPGAECFVALVRRSIQGAVDTQSAFSAAAEVGGVLGL